LVGSNLSCCFFVSGAGHEPPAEPGGSSVLFRLYVYALHGCLCELVFTAVCGVCSTQDQRLLGQSSLWALPMYALAIYTMERLRARLLARNQPLCVRLTVYTLFIYSWEFSWGLVLRVLGACPWDYSGFRYNVGGLVTLEYAVPWAAAAFIAEQHVISNTLRMRLRQKVSPVFISDFHKHFICLAVK
uniref:Transmembrane protein 229B n=1 Tax=Kryptolebias marmoratus TaxID=37003 RepID=A0A3Q3B061_KRYMA